MRVDVSDIKRGTGLWKPFEFEGPVHFEGLELEGPVRAKFKLTNVGSRILVDGELHTQVRLSCGRCAESFVAPLDLEVDEHFIDEASGEVPADENVALEDLNIFTYRDDRIEFDEILRQNLLAALPVKPLCQEDCQGLCDQCGTNLNQGSCSCPSEEIDPRWGPLMKLKNGS